ncbi:MAG TPA: hypothetical protein VM925_26665 [Labilithrix sp.]|nr:hypothetical protein [Labilithrix sp.]
MKGSACNMRGLVDAHFVGSITPEDERGLRAHLATCEVCRSHYRRRVLLASLDPAALGPEERIERALGLRRRRLGPRPIVTAVTMIVLAAAALLLFVRPQSGASDSGFSSRGGGVLTEPRTANTERGLPRSIVEVYRVPKDGRPTPATGSIRRDDSLAFAYENGARKERLVIFGVDEHRRVYWFHPGWTKEGDDPLAVAVSREPGLHELTEAVAHDFTGAHIDIHAVFLDDALSVRQIEERLDAGTLNMPGGIEHVSSFEVLP